MWPYWNSLEKLAILAAGVSISKRGWASKRRSGYETYIFLDVID
jgi:hypothetical protein